MKTGGLLVVRTLGKKGMFLVIMLLNGRAWMLKSKYKQVN